MSESLYPDGARRRDPEPGPRADPGPADHLPANPAPPRPPDIPQPRPRLTAVVQAAPESLPDAGEHSPPVPASFINN